MLCRAVKVFKTKLRSLDAILQETLFHTIQVFQTENASKNMVFEKVTLISL